MITAETADNSDDDVIIIEELSSIKRPRLDTTKSSSSHSSKPSNELTPKSLQSKTNQTEATPITVTSTTDFTKTPIVPRLRGSFYDAKHGEISHFPPTPTTPKLDQSHIGPPASRSGTTRKFVANRSGSAGRKLIRTTPTCKPSKRDELISSNYSTPKTTRGLLTKNLRPGTGNLKPTRRVTHLIYRPLELDNESSSESTDSIMKRRDSLRRSSQDLKPKLLAIEAPPRRSSQTANNLEIRHTRIIGT